MIVSASRRTDIPALYAGWFANRLAAGSCEVANPFNAKQVARVSLRPEDVDAFVFWTRHARPFFGVLPALESAGHRFVFQYTITGYGRPLEARTPLLEVAVDTFRSLAERLPSGSVAWRYDPIVVGEAFPAETHVLRFRRIAAALEGRTRRVVVSFLDAYRKTRRRVGGVFEWGTDVYDDASAWAGRHDLLSDLAAVAAAHGMTIEACAEEEDYSSCGVAPAKCVDDRWLAELFGGSWPHRKDPGQRPACRCVPSRDIGSPDTCTFGCTYCYATRSDDLASRRHAAHDASAPSLSR